MVSSGIENAAGNENAAVNTLQEAVKTPANLLPDPASKPARDMTKVAADRALKRRRVSADDADVAELAPVLEESDTCAVKRRRISTDAFRAKASAFLSTAAHGAIWASESLKQQAFPAVRATLSHATAALAAVAARLQPRKTQAVLEPSAVKPDPTQVVESVNLDAPAEVPVSAEVDDPAEATDPAEDKVPVEATVSDWENFMQDVVNAEEVAGLVSAQAPTEATVSDWEGFTHDAANTEEVAAPASVDAPAEGFAEQEAATGFVVEQGPEFFSPWVMLYDPSSGRPYYWNQETNEVAWELPQ